MATKTTKTSPKAPVRARTKSAVKTPTKSSTPKSRAKASAKKPTKSAVAKTRTKATVRKSSAKKSTTKAKSRTQKSAPKKISKDSPKHVVKTPAKPSTKVTRVTSKLSKEFLKSQLGKLQEERAKYMLSAEQLEEEAQSLLSERDSVDIQMAEDSGEGDTTAYYRELDLAISAQSREVVEQIDTAIERIKNGSYGICTDSGKPIPKKRLEAIPWASKTVEAKAGGLRRR